MAERRVLTPAEVIAERVREHRKRRGWSQATLAQQLAEAGVVLGQSEVSRLEKGQRSVSVDDLYGLAVALACPPLVLLQPVNDTDAVLVGGSEVTAADLRAWIVGEVQEHAFLEDLVRQLDAESRSGQPSPERDYIRGALHGRLIAMRRARRPAVIPVMANFDSEWKPRIRKRRRSTEREEI